MKLEWKVINVSRDNVPIYTVYRLIDTDKPDFPDNREYVTSSRTGERLATIDETVVAVIAEMLNEKAEKESPDKQD